MRLINCIAAEQRHDLRALRQRRPGVDLPHEAGTCGRMIDPASSRCLRCHNRREQLIRQLNLSELRMLAQVIHAEQLGQNLPGRIGAELLDLADGIEPHGFASRVDAEDLAGGLDAEDRADGVEPHAVRRATTPGACRRRVSLTPLLENWDNPGWESTSPCGHVVGR